MCVVKLEKPSWENRSNCQLWGSDHAEAGCKQQIECKPKTPWEVGTRETQQHGRVTGRERAKRSDGSQTL